MSADTSVPLPNRFDVMPYIPDGGGGSLAGTLQLVSILSSVGILVGLAVSFISQWFYLILIFPLFMGLCVGFVGGKTIERYHIRRPILCGLAGILAGSFCFLAMHYSDYWRFEQQLAAVPEEVRQIAQTIDQLSLAGNQVSAEVREVMGQLRAQPKFLRVLQVASFLGFMDLQAQEGVTISGHGDGNGMNLGYIGSIIYWLIEAFFLAWIATAIMIEAASRPYCCECNSWKHASPLIHSPVLPKLVADSVGHGDLTTFEQLVATADPVTNMPGLSSKVVAHICSNCESTAPFELGVVQIKTNKKGEKAESKVATTTYPGEALIPMLGLVARLQTPSNVA